MKMIPRERSKEVALAPGATVANRLKWEPRLRSDGYTWLVTIPLALVVFYAFQPVLGNGFVPSLDDNQNFLDNPYFRGLAVSQIKWAWTTYWVGAYQPLAWLLFGIQYSLFQLDPRGYHLMSLLLHVTNTVVLYILTKAFLERCENEPGFESPWPRSLCAGLATALFAVHPLRVEAVAWASCQPYLPCALFSMLSILAYLKAFQANRFSHWQWIACSFVLFVVALLFKAMAMALPAVLLILDVYPLRRFAGRTGRRFGKSARRVLLEKVPFVITSLFFMRLAIAAKPRSKFPLEHYVPSEGIAQACYSIWFYLVKTVLPLDLIAYYPLPSALDWRAPEFGVSIFATLAVSAALILVRRRLPGLLAAWLSYLVILAPNSGFIRINATIAADRYSYMPMLGWVIVGGWCFWRLWKFSQRWHPDAASAIVAIGFGAIVGLTALTRNQCRTWLNSETVWVHALSHGGDSSYLAHSVLGNIQYSQGKYAAAEAHFTKALRLGAGFAEAHNNLGNVLYAEGKVDEAVAHFTEAVRLHPSYADAHYNLGVIFRAKRLYALAEAHYAAAARLRPGFADAHKNLGFVLYDQGKYALAAAQFTEALRLHPGWADAHNSLGTIFSRQMKYGEAKAHLTEALRLQPGIVQAQYNLGIVCSQDGNYRAAEAHLTEAIRLDPNFAEAYNAMAMLLAACPDGKFRNGKRAAEFARRACELTNWKNPIVLDTLAAAQAETGDFDTAISSQRRAIALASDGQRKEEYRSRLALYQANRPYRQQLPRPGLMEERP